ncbi:MAG: PH domain-containing protein [Patescibacteria group bacterium]|nr:PH domain-containing protein [Patescibacteria group bacterium]
MNKKNSYKKEYRLRQTFVLPVFKIIMVELIIIIINFLTRFISFNYLGDFLNNFIIFIEILIIQLFNIYLVLKIIFSWISYEYIIRDDEIIIRQGLLITKEITYEIANLQSMIINQGLFGKIFNFGTIRLYNPVLKEEIFIENINNPNFYGDFIQKKEPEIPFIIKQNNQKSIKK